MVAWDSSDYDSRTEPSDFDLPTALLWGTSLLPVVPSLFCTLTVASLSHSCLCLCYQTSACSTEVNGKK